MPPTATSARMQIAEVAARTQADERRSLLSERSPMTEVLLRKALAGNAVVVRVESGHVVVPRAPVLLEPLLGLLVGLEVRAVLVGVRRGNRDGKDRDCN